MLPRLDKNAVSIVPLEKSGRDLEYWMKKTPIERLNAVEVHRILIYGEDKTTSRLQRFLEVDELIRG